MTLSDDDEDVRLAMALSMQQSRPAASAKQAVVDLTSDNEGEDDDEQLKRAIALSLQENAQPQNTSDSTSVHVAHGPSSSTITAPMAQRTQQAAKSTSSTTQARPVTNLFALDRKAMEQDRLARLGKTKRKQSSSPDRPSKQRHKALAPAVATDNTTSSHQPADTVLQYPRGVIKRTFATKFPRTDDITIDELLQASTLKIAVISSFQWDEEWLRTKIDYNKVKQIWVMNAKGADLQARWRQDLVDTGIPNLKVHFPPLEGATMNTHSKYMLLFSDEKLRVVITTANMEREYWGEVRNDWQPGVMENSSFVIDLPRRADGAAGSQAQLTNFGQELIQFLRAQKLEANVINGVLKFDFSQTGHLAFVHSM
jgi:hypothetical protein